MLFRTRTLATLLFGVVLLATTACPNETKDPLEELLPLLVLLAPPGGGTGAPSGSVSNLTATAGNGQVTLSWSYSGSGATGFKVYFTTDGSAVTSSSSSVTADGTGTTYTHASLENGKVYSYRVAATNGAGDGTISSTTVYAGPDGWTAATSGTTQTIRSVRRLGTQFWAIGNGTTVLRSNDGISWSAVALGCAPASTTLYDIAHDGSTKYRIVGALGTVITSDDTGGSWSCLVLNGADTYSGVSHLNGVWMIYGNVTASANLVLAVGTDGTNYNRNTLSTTFSFDTLRDAHYEASTGTWLIVGDDGRVLYCQSGAATCAALASNWSIVRFTSFGIGFDLYGAYYRDSKFHYLYRNNGFTTNGSIGNLSTLSSLPSMDIARLYDRGTDVLIVGQSGKVFSTHGGSVFAQRNQTATTSNLNGVACSSTRCVAAGDGGTIIYR